MLGRKEYNREELDHARAAIKQQLSAYRKLVKSVEATGDDPKVRAALETFETLMFNNMTLVLDRYFVHRLRASTGKDANPLNEVELLADSLINNGGRLRGNNVIKYTSDASVLGLEFDDDIALSASDFDSLSKAFFHELDARFVK